MTAAAELRLCGGLYDRTEAIADGRATAESIRLTYQPVDGAPAAWQMLTKGACDAAEVSICRYVIGTATTGLPYKAVAVFPSKMFRHHSIFVNRKKVEKPSDLDGAAIGVTGFGLSAPVWIRGMLRDLYQLDFSSVRWIEGPVNAAGEDDLSTRLADGRIDAIFAAVRPSSLNGNGDVVRLFEDFRGAEREYFERTRIFPIMHTVVVREDLITPDVAAAIRPVYDQSLELAIANLRRQAGLSVSLPWIYADLLEMDALDPDLWGNGLDTDLNAHTMKTLVRYLVEDGLINRQVGLDELFPFG